MKDHGDRNKMQQEQIILERAPEESDEDVNGDVDDDQPLYAGRKVT
jgi:hypothetical protein